MKKIWKIAMCVSVLALGATPAFESHGAWIKGQDGKPTHPVGSDALHIETNVVHPTSFDVDVTSIKWSQDTIGLPEKLSFTGFKPSEGGSYTAEQNGYKVTVRIEKATKK